MDNSAEVEAAGLSIKVKDAGRGIRREHLTRLFERFYRVDKARSRDMGGTGLGLSIVKHIAVAHGGWVAVESTPGLGSTFTITLPSNTRAPVAHAAGTDPCRTSHRLVASCRPTPIAALIGLSRPPHARCLESAG